MLNKLQRNNSENTHFYSLGKSFTMTQAKNRNKLNIEKQCGELSLRCMTFKEIQHRKNYNKNFYYEFNL